MDDLFLIRSEKLIGMFKDDLYSKLDIKGHCLNALIFGIGGVVVAKRDFPLTGQVCS